MFFVENILHPLIYLVSFPIIYQHAIHMFLAYTIQVLGGAVVARVVNHRTRDHHVPAAAYAVLFSHGFILTSNPLEGFHLFCPEFHKQRGGSKRLAR